MPFFPIFLTVVFVGRNSSSSLEQALQRAISTVSGIVADFEVIVVDNASEDESVAILKRLTQEHGLPNLQVYALTKEVDTDTAASVGLENALGDFVGVVDLLSDDIAFLPEMLEKALSGADVVFATNLRKARQSLAYRLADSMFNRLFRWFSGVDLAAEAPRLRLVSKRVVNFVLQHPQPSVIYRHLPATAGFSRASLTYSTEPKAGPAKKFGESIDRGMRLLISTTQAPMRLVTTLSLFGAVSNLVYSLYVITIALFKEDVAPGWTSLSLQQSGMFFLLSLVLLVLGEYVLHMARLTTEGPPYHVGQEFTSARLTRLRRLNVEDATPGQPAAVPRAAPHGIHDR
jgi:glycosyltransferase involved in cell wall biosynthesis